jgi:hypothetical protein
MLDTRRSTGGTAVWLAIVAGHRRVFSLGGMYRVPADAAAISVNDTGVSTEAEGALRVIARHLTSTLTSSLSIPLSQACANSGIVELSNDGLQKISVIKSRAGSIHFIMDINGYFR